MKDFVVQYKNTSIVKIGMQHDRTILMPKWQNWGWLLQYNQSRNRFDLFLEHRRTHIESSRHFFVQSFCISTFHYGYWITTGSFGKNNQVSVKVVLKKCSPPLYKSYEHLDLVSGHKKCVCWGYTINYLYINKNTRTQKCTCGVSFQL